MYFTEYPSPVGKITIVCDDEAIKGVYIEKQLYFMQSITQPLTRDDNHTLLVMASQWLADYFAGRSPAPDALPLAPEGTEFRRKVWNILRGIPSGETMTYGEIATRIGAAEGRRMSAQAIGGAVGHNPISIIIPCHRVIGSDGSLTGYAGGVHVKEWLLEHEGVQLG
ncbi:MAG: methylated-DNA--[protein]-cysteine S-methyltransferase [Eubacterium sp.]|nr:methylated-DNA--[protein]-cysteine S-methyltransferase [Candidatus Colimonas fimequi]